MPVNLVTNVKNQIVKSVAGWRISTVVLHWLNQSGKHEQFFGNKIREKDFIKWYYVPTKEHPVDVGSRDNLIWSISILSASDILEMRLSLLPMSDWANG